MGATFTKRILDSDVSALEKKHGAAENCRHCK